MSHHFNFSLKQELRPKLERSFSVRRYKSPHRANLAKRRMLILLLSKALSSITASSGETRFFFFSHLVPE